MLFSDPDANVLFAPSAAVKLFWSAPSDKVVNVTTEVSVLVAAPPRLYP